MKGADVAIQLNDLAHLPGQMSPPVLRYHLINGMLGCCDTAQYNKHDQTQGTTFSYSPSGLPVPLTRRLYASQGSIIGRAKYAAPICGPNGSNDVKADDRLCLSKALPHEAQSESLKANVPNHHFVDFVGQGNLRERRTARVSG